MMGDGAEFQGPWTGDGATIEQLFEQCAARLNLLANQHAVEVELLVEKAEVFSLSVQKSELEKYESSSSQCAGLRVLKDGYPGHAWTEEVSVSALERAFEQALENAEFTALSKDESLKVSLIEDSPPGTVGTSLPLANDSPAMVSVEEKIERARLLERVALEHDPRVLSVPHSGYTESQSEAYLWNSRGVRRRQGRSSVSGRCSVLVKDGDGARMGAEAFFARDARRVDVREVARDGARKALAKLGAKPPKTGRYPVVLESQVAAEIIGLVASGFSAKEVFEKNSLFAGRLWTVVAGPELTLIDDPHLEDGLGSRAFDGEGAWTSRTPLIEAGVLKAFVTDSVHSKRMGLPHTAHAARSARSELGVGFSNLVVFPGTEPLEALLNRYPRVILITEFKGYHAGYQGRSGDFSFESEGELWENGNRVGPLCNFVTSGNVKDLLLAIEAVGARYAPRVSSIVSPDLLIRELTIAGVD